LQASHIEESVASEFGLEQAPTLLAQRHLPKPIAFSKLRATWPASASARTAQPDAAFVFLVVLAPMAAGEIWIDGKRHALSISAPGDTFVFDIAAQPRINFTAPYDLLRFYLPAATLDRLAEDQDLPRVTGLRTTPLQVRDSVMHALALALLPMLDALPRSATRFVDSVALAFHAHVIRNYGGAPLSRSYAGTGLAPWQLRRINTFVDATLDTDPSIADLAEECRLSPGHFSRAFSRSVGTSPYKWLINRRIERAKTLLLGGADGLAQVALSCGFVDQSHFTRAFARSVGESSGRWRRQHGNPTRPHAATGLPRER
jgi:AraC family transcriptional regulator